ncbi:MAG: type II secretion system F family protein [Candidatus Brocadiia bacterium]
MPLFTYRAKKGPSEIITDTIDAENKEDVINKLTHEGLFPLSVKLEGAVKDKNIGTGGWFSRVKTRDINTMTRQLSSLLKAGVPLLKALHIITDQTENPHLRNIILDLSIQAKQGQMLSTSMSRYTGIFPPFYTAIIKSGEDSGALPEMLIRLADYRENTEDIKSRIRAALAYPIFVVVFGLSTIVFMMTVIIPKMQLVFDNSKTPLPWNTKILMGASYALNHYWYWIFAAIFIVLLIIRGIVMIDKKIVDKIKLGVPFINTFVKKSESAKFARTTGLLLNNGIPILSAMDIVIPTLSSEPIKEALKKMTNELRAGQSLANSMRNIKLFFPFMTNMIAVGEEGGHLDEVLEEVATFYEREITEATKIALALLEPILIVVIAMIVGFMVISILLPILQMGGMIQ